MSRVRNPKAGVTLLEMLIALAVMALLAAIGASVLSFSGRSLARIGDSAAGADIALARHDLRYWIEHALMQSGADGITIAADGDSRRLTLHVLLDDGLFWPGQVTVVTLGLDAAPVDPVVIATASGLSDSDQSPTDRTLTLSGMGARLAIRYFGRTSEDSSVDWHDTWRSKDGIPSLVQITISDSLRAYPPLIVRPGKIFLQREMSLSSLLPPTLPSRP